MSKPEITSTFYSDGKRQIVVVWESYEGQRKILHDLEDLIVKYFEGVSGDE